MTNRTAFIVFMLLLPAICRGKLDFVDVFTPGEMGFPCIRIPAIAMTLKGTLVAFAECRNYTGDGCVPTSGTPARVSSSRAKYVCSKTSIDGGKTWSSLRLVTPGSQSGQPTVVFDSMRSQLVLQYNSLPDNANMQIVSKDDGTTWSEPRALDTELREGARSDVGPGTGLSTANGTLAWIGHQGAYKNDFIWYSTDGGLSYELSKSAYGFGFPHMDEAALVQLSNGSIMANMRNDHYSPCKCRGVALSDDGGATFGPITYAPALISPVCQASILRYTSASGTTLTPDPLFFSNPASTTSRVNMTVRRSNDDGSTWPEALLVTSKGSAYSCLTIAPKGELGLLFETESAGCVGPSCKTVYTSIPLSMFRDERR